jgi:NADH-quinone oxidoreductase subunit D
VRAGHLERRCFPYVDRLNYVSPMLNNVGFALAVEKLARRQGARPLHLYRVILGELARISDHLTCNGAMAMELGAFTPFLWCIKAREWIWDILEEETGARLTHSFGRIGGMAKPPTENFKATGAHDAPAGLGVIAEGEALLLKNRIFLDRTQGVGVLQGARALLGVDGPGAPLHGRRLRRAQGQPVPRLRRRLRRARRHDGDNYDRFMAASRRDPPERPHHRAVLLEKMPDDGAVNIDDPRIVLPPKQEVYTTIEATINHFKIVMEGVKVPAGEVYSYTEGGNGELGFYLVSDGGGTPYRVRVRPPCFLAPGAVAR